MEAEGRTTTKKRKTADSEERRSKRSRGEDFDADSPTIGKAGKVKKILLCNFMCHENYEVELNPYVNFIVGRNGSGKSAILTALTVGLGARANVTSRGVSIKEFIKKGKQCATIEVTLTNNGPLAYKHDVYGDSITVVRRIGTSSFYKIKNEKGEVISGKRQELDNILRALNIQVENPISILNQDVSRTFLVTSKPKDKYELFMKATLLDEIGNNYEEAMRTCQEDSERLKHYNEILYKVRQEMEECRMKIKKAEKIEELRQEEIHLDSELLWATAIAEETKLRRAEESRASCEEYVKELQETESYKGEEMDKKIQDLQEEIKRAEEEVAASTELYNKAKEEYMDTKNKFLAKEREWISVQSKVKHTEDNISTIQKEIQRLESHDDEEQNERNKIKTQLAGWEKKLHEIEALIQTKHTSKLHLATDKEKLTRDVQNKEHQVRICNDRIRKIEQDLRAVKQQSDNATSVFGRNIPRLLRRIEEEHRNRRFKKQPCGPLGAYIKMKDRAWIPAVENFLGSGLFSTFCVDNNEDAKVLKSIMNEIFLNERPPMIICSKFYDNVHDVRNHCTRSPNYSNLLEAMDISHPVVANCLIDQRQVECVLLIPTSKEAAEVMSNGSRVPRNCRRAISLKADDFYPDPNYRSYGGPRNLRAKFLQVSTTDTINALEEDLRAARNEKTQATQSYNATREKEARTTSEFRTVNEELEKLRRDQNRYRTNINELKDQLEFFQDTTIATHRDELMELKKKVQQEKTQESCLRGEVQELRKTMESLEERIKRFRGEKQNLEAKVNPLKSDLRQLQDDKEMITAKGRHAAKKLEGAKQRLQNAFAEFEVQNRVTEKALAEASQRCDRINTERSVSELKRLFTEKRGEIRALERELGTIEHLRKELKDKEQKYGKELQLSRKMDESVQKQLKRLAGRKSSFKEMKREYGLKIQDSFKNVLDLRNKKGLITIDHEKRTLELEVSSQNDEKRPTNDARSLSGGERSYSTVAFILALWDCTGLPFYFLDEFDVFMDNVHRRAIMDILSDHAKSHLESQFTFLTPLDTSHIRREKYVDTWKLASPERTSQSQAA